MPLMANGKRPEHVQAMIDRLAQQNDSGLTLLAEQQAEKLDNPDVLQHLTMELFGAADVNEARQLLLHIDGIGEYN